MVSIDRRLFGRREFLVVTSASLATAALSPTLFAAASDEPSLKRLAVGFAHTAGKAHLMDAASIPTSDPVFLRLGASVAVSGSSGTPDAADERRIVDLLTHFSYFDGANLTSAPFHAWSASRVTGEQGNRVRFPVPVDLQQKLLLTIVVESGDTAGARISRRRAAGSSGGTIGATPLPLVLSVQNEASAIPLMRGYYVVVPLFDSESAPVWSRYHLSLTGGRWTLTDDDGRPAHFEHLVLEVAYGEST